MGAVRAIHALGLQDRIALVGFDDIPMADVVQPGVTVVAQDPLALGRQAAELLFARLDGHDGPTREIVVPTRLVERGSGELPGPA
jgi:LacI family transcriptional regulator